MANYYKKVVEMLGENLASFLELSKKLLIDWKVEPKKLLHFLQNIRKDDLIGLMEGTHEVREIPKKDTQKEEYTSEVVNSDYTYPKEYKGPKCILDQIDMVEKQWGLDGSYARSFVANIKKLPDGAEGWFAIPKVSAVAKKHFPAITNPAEQYCEAVKLVLTKLAESRSFTNYREGEIIPEKLRVHLRTAGFIEELENQQQGDILIIAVQYGMRHRGKSIRRARETFASNEFGLGSFALGCMALIHPERYVRWEELDTDCPGDEFSPDADGVFSKSPIFIFYVRLKFDTNGVSDANDNYGSASAFVPQV